MNYETSLKVATLAANFPGLGAVDGAVESLIEHGGPVEGPKSPCPNDLLQLSAGIETVDGLYEGLVRALKA